MKIYKLYPGHQFLHSLKNKTKPEHQPSSSLQKVWDDFTCHEEVMWAHVLSISSDCT